MSEFEEYMNQEEQEQYCEIENKRLKITFRLKPISAYVFNQLQKEARVIPMKTKNGFKTKVLDAELLHTKMLCACIESPDLYNATLQDRYQSTTPEELIQKMLLPEEYINLLNHCLTLCGFEDDEEEELENVKK